MGWSHTERPLLLLPILFFAVGLGVFTLGIFQLRQSLESRSWQATDGRIVSSRVEEERTKDSDGNYSTSYRAKVEFTYFVNGMELRSNRVSIGEYSGSSSHAYGITGRYPVERAVTVYYNPERTSLAVLETGISFGNFIPLILGVFIMGFPVALWYVVYRR